MKKELIIPNFKTEAEESKFWTSLDLTEYFEPSDFKRGVVFPNLKQAKRDINPQMHKTDNEKSHS